MAVGKKGLQFAFPAGQSAMSNGMELRDYFAAQIAAGDASWGEGWVKDASSFAIANRALLYYRIADAMLEARSQKT